VLNPQDDLWYGVVGKYGIKERNFAGEDFLQFYQCNQLSIMDTRNQSIMALGCILLQNSII